MNQRKAKNLRRQVRKASHTIVAASTKDMIDSPLPRRLKTAIYIVFKGKVRAVNMAGKILFRGAQFALLIIAAKFAAANPKVHAFADSVFAGWLK